jgi:hypothetical protein
MGFGDGAGRCYGRSTMTKSTIGILVILVLFIGVGAYVGTKNERPPLRVITNFAECEEAGYPVGESYPRQCWTSDGRHFVEEIEEEE